MQIVQTARFAKVVKKLHTNQKQDLDTAIHCILADPTVGEMKIADLAGIRVYKFKMVGQLTLLAYRFADEVMILTLLAVGSHENFYRDLKK